MAENEISILIKAVDEISSTVKKIESNITSMSVESAKQTKALSSSFSAVQGNLLVLGQAASRVDTIFSSLVKAVFC